MLSHLNPTGHEPSSDPEESPLDPELPIIDAHHHLWIEPPRDIFAPYPREAFLRDIDASGHRVVASVYVECGSRYLSDGPEHMRPVGEVMFANAIGEGATGPTMCAAIVGYADLLLGSRVGQVLDAQMAASRRFRGIRFKTAFDPALGSGYGGNELGIMSRAQFHEGTIELAKRGLSFDAWLFHPQLPEFVAFARAVPDLTIILDHTGGPIGVGPYSVDRAAAFAAWRGALAEAAMCPNVFLKLGSLNMAYAGLSLPGAGSVSIAAAQRDHILAAIDLFGPSRCMFESNFPVEQIGISYGRLWNTFKRIAECFAVSERDDLFARTAMRAYRIQDVVQ